MFKPFDNMKIRVLSSKNDSDVAYFYDLLLYGEFVTKVVSVFLTSSINDDSERSRYRQEYNIARANAIGDFVRSIDEVLTGPSAGLICSSIRDLEIKELTQRAKSGDWQYECQRLLYDVLSMFKLEHNDLDRKSVV